MHLPIFQNAYLLQSVGWGIVNSFWQAVLLWLIYKSIIGLDKKMPALVKYHLSLILTFGSFNWFICTVISSYSALVSDVPAMQVSVLYWKVDTRELDRIFSTLSILYFFLLVIYSLQFFNKLRLNHSLQHKGLQKAPLDFRLFVNSTALHLGIKKKVSVWISGKVDVPSVSGFLKPIILLPAAIITNLSIKQAEAVLLHELAHIKRNDYIVNLLQSVIELVMFFNPFTRMLSNAARKERENCCDDWVLTYRYNQFDYANALLALEEQRLKQPALALAATNSKKNLLKRIKRLFANAPHTGFTPGQRCKMASLSAFLLVFMFFMIPQSATEKQGWQQNLGEKLMPKPASFAIKQNNIEAPATNILLSEQIDELQPAQKPPVAITKKVSNNPAGEKVYVDALINQELLDDATTEAPIAALASEATSSEATVYVRVEEEQSGKGGTKTYYFEINNKDGKTEVKPLLILNKLVLKKQEKVSPDSLKVTIKKRITS